LRRHIERVQHHVQAAAMRHAQDDAFDAVRGGAFDRLAQQRDDAFAPLEAELLVRGEVRPMKLLERFRRDKLPEDAPPVVALGPETAARDTRELALTTGRSPAASMTGR